MHLDPLIEGDRGHYVAAIKINATWNIFDDKKSKSHFASSKKEFYVHTVMYIKESKVDFNSRTITTEDIIDGAKTNAKNGKENLVPVINRDHSQPSSEQHVALPSKETPIERMSILTNGCTYKVENLRIFLKNTCSFDSVAHVRHISTMNIGYYQIVKL